MSAIQPYTVNVLVNQLPTKPVVATSWKETFISPELVAKLNLHVRLCVNVDLVDSVTNNRVFPHGEVEVSVKVGRNEQPVKCYVLLMRDDLELSLGTNALFWFSSTLSMGGEILFLRYHPTTPTVNTSYQDEQGCSHWPDGTNPTATYTRGTSSSSSGTVRLPTPVLTERSVEESSTDSDTILLPTPSRTEQLKEIETITLSSDEETADSDEEWLPDQPLPSEAESSSDDSDRSWDVKRRRRYALRNFIL